MKKLLPKFSVLPILLLLLIWTTAGILPIFDQSLVASKFLFLSIITLFVLVMYLGGSLKKGVLSFVRSPFTIPTFIFGLITLISIFSNNKFPVESLLGFGGVFLSFSLLIGLGSNLIKSQPSNNNKLMVSLAGLSGLLAVTTVLQQFGYGPTILFNKLFNLNLPNNIIFNMAGSVLVALQFTLITAVGFATKVLITKKAKLWESVTLAISAIATLFYGWFLLPGKLSSPVILSPTASWSVAMSSMRSLKNVLIGVGPDNYIKAFNLYKPQWLNNGPLWSVQFSQGANLPLTLLVTLGVFGLIAWLLFALVIIKQSKKISKATRPIHAMLVATLLMQLFLPVNIVMIVLQAILIIFWVASEKDRFHSYGLNLNGIIAKVAIFKKRPEIISRGIIGLVTIASIGLLYLTLQASYSSFLMYKASKAATTNDFVSAYSLQQQAIKLNPYLDTSRRKYAITNIVIAAAISQKTDITDEDKERFATLIQQAIREGKAALLLDGNDATNWQTLAQVYQTLIGVADNSEEWAIRSYADAIKLSPNNPQLRVTLGGVFFNAKEYGEALRFFDQAATLKPDYANAYYNAANTFKMLREFEEAKIAYQKTLILLQPDSDDYLRAADELQVLEEIAKGEIEKQAQEQSEVNNVPVDALDPIEDVTPEVEAPPEEISVVEPATPAVTEETPVEASPTPVPVQ
jgi:tetratricopeptide (TPR) repeat protein